MSGAIKSEVRPVESFDKITLKGFGDLEITQADAESLVVEADEDTLGRVKSTIKEGVLVLNQDFDWLRLLIPRPPLKFRVTVKNLRGISVSGSGKVNVGDVKTDVLEIRISGAADIAVSGLVADSLELATNGAGNCKVGGGKATKQKMVLNGAGHFESPGLEGENVSVRISGAGSATVWAKETLEARISGAGNISYFGSPKLTTSISGFGDLKHLGDK
ncbi:MAG: head GIN domain-containing protein [Candidatus Brocadiia bacterium]